MTLDPAKITVLLVEDAATMRKIEMKTLTSLGFENIIEAKDGEDAVDRLRQTDGIDLVISDWNMPNRNGFDLLVWVRADKRYHDVPFIMATG
ncbi:MAG: response regulator, partial [Desulfobacteraceae bacterium]